VGEWLHRIVQREAQDELLDREIFTTLLEAKVLIENWRREYNTIRPHSSLRYKPRPGSDGALLMEPCARVSQKGGGLTLKVVQ